MAKNPDFVRLADHMIHGMVVDMETGWSLSGYDVQPFPEDTEQARFVRQKINASIIEPATQSEYDAAHPVGEEDEKEAEAAHLVELVKAAAGRGGGQQEHKMRAKHADGHAAIQRERQKARLREAGVEFSDDADLDFAEDQARREAAAAAAAEEPKKGKK